MKKFLIPTIFLATASPSQAPIQDLTLMKKAEVKQWAIDCKEFTAKAKATLQLVNESDWKPQKGIGDRPLKVQREAWEAAVKLCDNVDMYSNILDQDPYSLTATVFLKQQLTFTEQTLASIEESAYSKVYVKTISPELLKLVTRQRFECGELGTRILIHQAALVSWYNRQGRPEEPSNQG